MLNFWPFYIREVWRARLQGCNRIALFGAGEHTRWLLGIVQNLAPPEVVALFDDAADRIREIRGVAVLPPGGAGDVEFDAVVVSSDAQEEKLLARARECFPGRRVVRLYEGLPPGPYDKQGELPAGIDTLPGPAETVNLETVVQVAGAVETKQRLIEVFHRMEPDPYVRRITDGYARAISRFGPAWRYVDLWCVLYAYARLARPVRYLEVGTRRGHSLAAAWAGWADGGGREFAPVCCDCWVTGYAGTENGGPTFVTGQMKRLGFEGSIEFLSGSSHELLPGFLRSSAAGFDLITVDGDHSREGARADLLEVLGSLRLGGMLAFDDINHPQHGYLGQVWRESMTGRCGWETYENPRDATGIAAAIRYRRA
ncbi:MAG: class I SAM-dependent methyltransferase [Planctomycetes bacterium]|nr:class I SAM-dependent methyltransferase [Planctomycetota bacterium]